MRKTKTLLCFGTRPEWIKIKPIYDQDPSKYRLLFTGQHVDLLKDIRVDYQIKIKNAANRLDQIIADCLTQFPVGNFTGVLVQGDTASAFACALAAFHRKLPLFYLESGLRTYNLEHPYPEEGYRQMISRIANIHFCPTDLSAANLSNEFNDGDIHVTGNTVLDNIKQYKDKIEYQDKVLITMHRRENHHIMSKWFTEINNIAKENPDLEFIIPLHPNPNVQKHKGILQNITVIDPVSHEELIKLLTKCKLVISDSGGIQEEATFLNKKVIVCREVTERPEGIGTGHLYLCRHPDLLKETFGELIKNTYINNKCPYGDGEASQRIHHIINYGT